MSSALLGIIAAVCWGIHDLLAAIASRAIGQKRTTAAVTIFGFAAITAWLALRDVPPSFAIGTGWIALLSGACIALATLWLFAAMANGPLSLALPVVMTYPATSLALAAIMGRPPTVVQAGLALLIIAGVVAVAISGATDEDGCGATRKCIGYALLSHVSFAIGNALGQHAAAITGAAAATWLSRLGGLALIVPLVLFGAGPKTVPSRWLPALALMGMLDVVALLLINHAGTLPYPEIAIVGASGAVVISVILARMLLGEPIQPLRWAGIAAAVSGVALLTVFK
ncbi:MAG: EamA family transporter [Hyphomicrobiales bacterium]